MILINIDGIYYLGLIIKKENYKYHLLSHT